MRTAVDTSVLLDVLTDDSRYANDSEAALRQAREEGAVLVGETVVAEVRPVLPREEILEFLADWGIQRSIENTQ